jgi:RNA polymerase sigma factor (sigma-70 family)
LQIARAAAAGDTNAIGVFYEARFDLVFGAAKRVSGRDEHFCLDVVQETFVRVMRSRAALARLADEEHVDRWLLAVTQSVTLDLLRGERRRMKRERDVAGRKVTADAGANKRIAEIERELAALPAVDRDLLMMRSSGMTIGAIAEAVGATVGSVQGKLRRAARAIAGRVGGEP